MRQRQDARKKPERRMKTPRYPALPPGLRLLVLEDNTILALDVEDMLLRNGAAQVEVVGTCEEALQQLDSATRSEEHTSELQSLMRISYAVFCLKKKNNKSNTLHSRN